MYRYTDNTDPLICPSSRDSFRTPTFNKHPTVDATGDLRAYVRAARTAHASNAYLATDDNWRGRTASHLDRFGNWRVRVVVVVPLPMNHDRCAYERLKT